MVDWYVDSAAAGTGSGTSWVNAKTTLAAAATAAAAGDRIFIKNTSAETGVATNTITFPGNTALPNLVISTTSADQPPTSADYLAGASVTTTGNARIVINGSAYIQGVTFNSGNGNNSPSFFVGNGGNLYFKNCALALPGTGGSDGIDLHLNNNGRITFDNTTVQFGATSDSLIFNWAGSFEWLNTPSAIQGATIPSTLFLGSTQLPPPANPSLIHGVDLSAITGTLVGETHGLAQYTFADCKFNAAATLSSGGFAGIAGYVNAINCDSGATGYVNQWRSYPGVVSTETTITLKNGASDGVQSVSHKYVTNANPTPNSPLIWPPQDRRFGVWNTTTGKSVTATVQIISSGALNNNDIWLEIEYLGSAASPVSSFANNGLANPLSTAAAQTSSTAAWNSQPATPVTQQLQVSFTPQMVGYVYGRIMLGKASTTVYVDPELTIK